MGLKLNWEATLPNWTISIGAVEVTDPKEVDAIVSLLKHFGEKRYDDIGVFGKYALKVLDTLKNDKIDKTEVLSLASQQLAMHKKVWHSRGKKQEANLKTYEMPFFHEGIKVMRYMKFQFSNKQNCMYQPIKVKKLDLDYHISDHVLEAIYET